MNKHAEEEREGEEDDNQVVMAVGMLHQSSQAHCGSQVYRGSNVDRRMHSRGQYRMQPHVFNKIMHDVCNYDAYFVQKYDATGVLGLLSEQKLTASLRMLAFGASAN
ncbi:unnamed protein product [Prunus armeniaca]